MSKEKQTDVDHQATILSLLASSQTLSLGTLNPVKQPEVSLVPFLYHDSCFWIFVSQLSAHTQHLLERPEASVLIYDNQNSPKNCFAVERVNAQCAVRCEDAAETKAQILDAMTEKLGETVSLLRQLGDFSLFALKPEKGRFIAGFGQAFDIDFSDFSFTHIDPSKG